MKNSPFVTKKKTKPKSRFQDGVIEQLVGLGGDIGRGVARAPKDIITGVPGDVTGKKSEQSVIPSEVHSNDITEALYGQSLSPQQRENLEQKRAQEEIELANQRKIIESFKRRRKDLDAPTQQKPSIQDELEREEEQKKQVEAAQLAEQRKRQVVQLPSSGASKQPGFRKRLKRKQRSFESKQAFKGAG